MKINEPSPQWVSPTLGNGSCNGSGKSAVHKRQLKPMNVTTSFKLHSLDSNNDFNDLSSDVSMYGVADYNPSINDTSRYVIP